MTEWTKKKYNEAYTEYMPWIEDKVLGYWGENKTSYTAKGNVASLSYPFPLLSFPASPLHPHSPYAPLTPFLRQKSSTPTSPATRTSKPSKVASPKVSAASSLVAVYWAGWAT